MEIVMKENSKTLIGMAMARIFTQISRSIEDIGRTIKNTDKVQFKLHRINSVF